MSDFHITFLASGLSLNSSADARKENRWCTSWQWVINLILISCVCPYASWLWILSLYFPKLQCFQREVPFFLLWCYLCRWQRGKNPDAAERRAKTHTFTWLTRTSKSLTWAPTELWDVFFLFFFRTHVCADFLLHLSVSFYSSVSSPVKPRLLFFPVSLQRRSFYSPQTVTHRQEEEVLWVKRRKKHGKQCYKHTEYPSLSPFFNPFSSVFVLDF